MALSISSILITIHIPENGQTFWIQRRRSGAKAKVPQRLPFELTEEGMKKGFRQCAPVVADPVNLRLLICYGGKHLFAYRPTVDAVERISEHEMRGWNPSHAVVDGVLYSSTREVDWLSESLFAYDLDDRVRPLKIDWYYSASCIRRNLFKFPSESNWEAVVDLGSGKLFLAMNLTMLWGSWDIRFFIGGMIVEVHRRKSSSSSQNRIAIRVLSTFLIPVSDDKSDCRAMDFLSIPAPAVDPAVEVL